MLAASSEKEAKAIHKIQNQYRQSKYFDKEAKEGGTPSSRSSRWNIWTSKRNCYSKYRKLVFVSEAKSYNIIFRKMSKKVPQSKPRNWADPRNWSSSKIQRISRSLWTQPYQWNQFQNYPRNWVLKPIFHSLQEQQYAPIWTLSGARSLLRENKFAQEVRFKK